MDETPENSNKAVWDIESTHPEIVEKLREAFQQVNDPGVGVEYYPVGLGQECTNYRWLFDN